jgi:uncharacterized membrane protein
MTPAAPRRHYLDVLRGLAVLVMIEAHVIDSWTRATDRETFWFGASMILGGFGAPLFLFLAGVAVSLSASSKSRRLGDDRAAARLVEKRGAEIFGLAFLFRLQSFVISRSASWALLKVDILNIMGPAIAGCAWLWGLFRGTRARILAFTAATALIAFVTPPVRALGFLGALPRYVQGYIRPVPGLTNFTFFPWAAFVTAGAVVGALIDAGGTARDERRLMVWCGAGGASIAVAAFALSYLPSPYPSSFFWTSSPAFFFLRAGILIATVGLAFAWERRPGAQPGRGPMALLGRSSLFVYWIHVEMVYGVVSTPLHRALGLTQAWLALGIFSVFMLACAVLKTRFVDWWRTRGPSATAGSGPAIPSPARGLRV